MNILTESIIVPNEYNFIFGNSHFIKTVEDLYEAIVTAVPGAKFGIAFNEASGPCLIRKDGTADDLIEIAVDNQRRLGAGHTFLIVMSNIYPINILPVVKSCREVTNIFCATANPVQVIIAETEQGRGVLGVIDGGSPKGVETEQDIEKRKNFLRTIGYKR
ncbi:MAG: adenosine-specific kinase [Candidatus Cloacimonetes bacterium]|nr:adenosine-specific kinase [Candidatus Cloacimonadota bacterium]